MAYSLLVQWLTLSPFVHCAVGDGEVVMEVRPDGIRFWPDLAYSVGRGVSWVYEVPTSNQIEWSRWEYDTARRGPLASFAYLFTGGLLQASNCVTETKAVLALAGVDVPRKVLTPAHLWDWLREQGYELSSVDGSA